MDIVPTGQAAVAAREQAATARAELLRRQVAAQKQMTSAKAELQRQRAELEAEFRRRTTELDAVMAPLKAELAKVEEVSWTIDLYLGRDEQVDLLIDGDPAPANEPLVIRQMVLAADEESILHADQGGLDFRQMGDFVEWVVADRANLDRILPDTKGVVVVVPSRQVRDYGDGMVNTIAHEHNKQAYWFIRNGDRLHLLVTDPNLIVGSRLLPKRTEFVDFFTDRTFGQARRLEPGSDAWVKAEQKADARRRHFMRLMLVLQGIIDRSTALRPLPEGGIDLMSLDAQDAGKVVLVNELDLVLTDGRPSFTQWLRDLNSRLVKGMRVVVAASHPDFRDMYHGWDRNHREYHERVTPRAASYPPADTPLAVEDRDGEWVVRYARTDQVERKEWVDVPDKPGWVRPHWEMVTPKVRATCVIRPDDAFVLPFDLATETDLTYYLGSRAAREGYLAMVPILKAALAAKRLEREAETPFREYLLARMAEAEPDTDTRQLSLALDELVHWWKTSTVRNRPLVGDPQAEAKAARAILAERTRRVGSPARSAQDAAVVAAAKAIPSVFAVARARSGVYTAYGWSDRTVGPWVTRYDLDRHGVPKAVTPWQQIAPRTLASFEWLWRAESLPADFGRVDGGMYLTGPERDQIVADLNAALTAHGHRPVVVTQQLTEQYRTHTPARRLTAYGIDGGKDLAGAEIAKVDDVIVEAKATWTRSRGKVTSDIGPVRTGGYVQWSRYSPRRPEGADPFADRGMSVPWSEPSDRFHKPDRPVTVWADERAMAVVHGVHETLTVRSKADREDSDAVFEVVAGLREAVREAWLARETATARARFDVDFGRDADDVWPHHLSTLKLDRKYREPDGLFDVLRRAVRNGLAVRGRSIAEVLAADDLHTGNPVTMPGFEDLLIPEAAE